MNKNDMIYFFEAIKLITTDADPIISSIDLNNLDITTTTLNTSLSYDSRIIVRLISKGLISQLEHEILTGILENNDKDIIKDELVRFLNSGSLLGVNTVDELNTKLTNAIYLELVLIMADIQSEDESTRSKILKDTVDKKINDIFISVRG